jgi:hypothetical protein
MYFVSLESLRSIRSLAIRIFTTPTIIPAKMHKHINGALYAISLGHPSAAAKKGKTDPMNIPNKSIITDISTKTFFLI